jgi:hypothetical protein
MAPTPAASNIEALVAPHLRTLEVQDALPRAEPDTNRQQADNCRNAETQCTERLQACPSEQCSDQQSELKGWLHDQ